MPKMKTNSSAKKRFKVTGTGKVTRAKAFKNHILTKKATKRKRHLGHDGIVSDSDMGNVKFMLRLGK
ncbi:MAG: 50S ribosomal protein L35 [Bacteroidetes bacterium]|nr:50S ribosomal protein L35 [Bacteroidota bacterium]